MDKLKKEPGMLEGLVKNKPKVKNKKFEDMQDTGR